MSDIVERLNRGEGCREEGGKTCIDMSAEGGCICAIAADTITRLRDRLEIDPSHPYDGIYCRDETIRHQDATITRLRERLERLRAALLEIAAQKKTTELVTATDVEYADFEDGYDMCIDRARAAITQEPRT